MKIEQHTFEQSMGQKRNHKEIQKILRQMKTKLQHKNLRDAAKAILRGKFIAVNSYLH